MVSTGLISATDHVWQNTFQVWCPAGSAHSVLLLIPDTAPIRLVKTALQPDADFVLLDWRVGASEESLPLDGISLDDASIVHSPLLIVIDEKTDLPARLSATGNVELSRCEFLTSAELKSSTLEVRINKLLHTTKRLTDKDLERKKAEELRYQSDRAFIAKNRLIATASHDIRQPLHALGLFVGALKPTVTEDEKVIVENIHGCVSALNQLLESLLDISKLDANVLSIQKRDFKVAELLQSLQAEWLGIARDKSLSVYCSADEVLVCSDEILLRRILRNLITNAINYTEHSRITLTATLIEDKVEILVADTGIGIPEDQQEHVFDEFFKVESSLKGSQEGLELGLSIVKRLCTMLNIDLRIDSQIGAGTRVLLAIPLG